MIPTMMRAVVLIGHGCFDQLEYREEWLTPVPAPGDVLVEVVHLEANSGFAAHRSALYP